MAELLGTFAAPTSTECAIIRGRIQQIGVVMGTLDREIERVEMILERLRSNRSALQKVSIGHHNVLNPTRRLPVEILGQIFVLLQGMLGGRSIAPTQICRHWRDVAIGTSTLWNCIKVPHSIGRTVSDAEMVALWLQRSGGQPLTILLGCESLDWGQSEWDTPTFDTVIGQAHRWKEFKLHVNDSIVSFLKKIPEDLPMLETLYITGHCDEATSFAKFRNASALRFVTLDGWPSSPMSIFPWAQMTKCSLLGSGEYTCQDGYYVLSQAGNLQAYKMELDASSAALGVHPPPGIRLEHLMSLDIDVIEGGNMRHLLDLLTLPALTNLRVIETLTDDLPERIMAMITRSHCTLKQLSLGSQGGFTRNELFNIFTHTPLLAELELTFDAGVGLDKSLMDLMTHHPDHAAGPCCLLPQLVSIKLDVNSCLSYEEFAEFLLMRSNISSCESGAMAQLRTAALMAWDDTTASGRRAYHLPEETYKKFLQLRNSGLDLHILEDTIRLELEDYFIPGEEEDDSEEEGDGDSEYEEEDSEDEADEDSSWSR
ncbi:hypothetical protein HWV62_35558 [Athelia sp. TMB]|nr:hypothetical protein HWV62_35558 [Athelia sp. TMB]